MVLEWSLYVCKYNQEDWNAEIGKQIKSIANKIYSNVGNFRGAGENCRKNENEKVDLNIYASKGKWMS